jgi:hypothetical protein
VMGIAAFFGMFAGVYNWFPNVRRFMNETMDVFISSYHDRSVCHLLAVTIWDGRCARRYYRFVIRLMPSINLSSINSSLLLRSSFFSEYYLCSISSKHLVWKENDDPKSLGRQYPGMDCAYSSRSW